MDQLVSVKKQNTLNYPILFGYLGDLAKFSRILHEHRIFSEHSHFILHLAMISLLLCLEHRVKHCQIFTKKTQVKKYSIFMKYVSKKICLIPRSIQIESDSSRCLVFFTDTVWILDHLDRLLAYHTQLDLCALVYFEPKNINN